MIVTLTIARLIVTNLIRAKVEKATEVKVATQRLCKWLNRSLMSVKRIMKKRDQLAANH